MQITTYEELRAQLDFYAEDSFREFTMRGIPSERPFFGVRIPQVRKIAGQIPQEKIVEFLDFKPVAFEEVLIRGMLICRLPYSEMLKYFDSQVEYIDDWATCDTFCPGLKKIIKKHRAEFLDEKVEPLLKSGEEFAIRVGLIILKSSYLDADYLGLIFDRVESLKNVDKYYVKMAIAWLLSECFVKFPEETLGFLKATKLPAWTFNKTVSKICDSFRVESETKKYLKTLRKS
ncbi:DNA alkylation repair protein [Candidatus Saccharibacteria bacterium]|nr:DNA alkylation repair protein [Candidatus Saccharibacteria bacterium]